MNLYNLYINLKQICDTYIEIKFKQPLSIRQRKALRMDVYSMHDVVDFQMDDSDGEDYEIVLPENDLKEYDIYLTKTNCNAILFAVFTGENITI